MFVSSNRRVQEAQSCLSRNVIYCHEVTKRFRNVVALGNVSLQVPAGGICAVIGPNGAGKSTLLKVFTGMLAPSDGDIRVAGLDVRQQSLEAKRIIGVLPEDLGLFDRLTVEEHLELTGPVYGLTRKQTDERAEPLLRLLGLADMRHTLIDDCSHGMRKKTALAMALLPDVRVLFLDEPFEGVDPVASKSIAELLASIARRGITTLLTSHSLAMVDRLATQIALIRNGRIIYDSATRKLPQPLEELYFELVEKAPSEDLAWLRLPPS